MSTVPSLLSKLGVWFMRVLAPLPLRHVRALGWFVGWLVYSLTPQRRQIVRINLLTCFPELHSSQREALVRRVFVHFTQAWLDRSWLWHGTDAQRRERLKISGDVDSLLLGSEPCVLFAPHFMGLDAGWTALNGQLAASRRFCTIYLRQKNQVVDQWIEQGRTRVGQPTLIARHESMRDIAQSIRKGEILYLLPDMDLGADAGVFVPFFGTLAATVHSLPRFAKLGAAQVRSAHTVMTSYGYETLVSPVWAEYPTANLNADTERMNRELEALIRENPAQYYWVHKRFKTRPAGDSSIYGR